MTAIIIRLENYNGHLLNLRRRPRCADGRLDMRASVNKSFAKDAFVTDYYELLEP